MPHKVNPIRFENAEANLELSSALLDTLATTLVTSRLQRDLTDSTTQRNIGPAFGHSLLAIDNVARGLRALSVDADLLARELDENWEVLGEPVQSAMRAASVAGVTGMENPYERLKELTRGRRLTADDMREFIGGLGLPDDVAARLVGADARVVHGPRGRARRLPGRLTRAVTPGRRGRPVALRRTGERRRGLPPSADRQAEANRFDGTALRASDLHFTRMRDRTWTGAR